MRFGLPPRSGGLSPRVRGNRVVAGGWCGPARSIPACAGEPSAACTGGITCTVYPRVCGGTNLGATGNLSISGLSPRVRGNPKR